jgi:hypothetical protein
LVRELELRSLAYRAEIALAPLCEVHDDSRDLFPSPLVLPNTELGTHVEIHTVQLGQLGATRNAEQLKVEALQVMAMAYKKRGRK